MARLTDKRDAGVNEVPGNPEFAEAERIIVDKLSGAMKTFSRSA